MSMQVSCLFGFLCGHQFHELFMCVVLVGSVADAEYSRVCQLSTIVCDFISLKSRMRWDPPCMNFDVRVCEFSHCEASLIPRVGYVLDCVLPVIMLSVLELSTRIVMSFGCLGKM